MKSKQISYICVIILLLNLITIPIENNVQASNDWSPYLRISILEYSEDLYDYLDDSWLGDPLFYGDPYFRIELDEDADGTYDNDIRSETFEDSPDLINPFYYDFVLLGNYSSIKFSITVWDEDILDDDQLDYVPSASSYSYSHTLDYQSLKTGPITFGPYDGENDNQSAEKDCYIIYKAELFNWNVAPILGDIEVIGKSDLYVSQYEPVYLSASCFDPNADTLTFEWDFGDGHGDSNDVGYNIYTETGSFSVSLTVYDTVTSSTVSATVHVVEFAYSQYINSNEIDSEYDSYGLITDYTKILYPEISTEYVNIPWPFEIMFWISLVVDVEISHVGDLIVDVTDFKDDYYDIENSLYSSNDEYIISILPHFEINFLGYGDSFDNVKTFDLPIPTTNPQYPDQSSIEIKGTTFYFWNVMVEVDDLIASDSLGDVHQIDTSFNVATIDLIPYIDALINSGLPGWSSLMSIGQQFSDWMGLEFDRTMDLMFNIDLTTLIMDEIWLHQKTTSSYIWDDSNTPIDGTWDDTTTTGPLSFTGPIEVSVNYTDSGHLTDMYPYLVHLAMVEVSGSLDLKYGYTSIWSHYNNTVNLLDLSAYGVSITDRKFTTSFFTGYFYVTPPPDFDNDGIPDERDTDDDNDGVPDLTDAFPFDPLESLDSDLDGIGNNADNDDDDDGIFDSNDAFPLDPDEDTDTDKDGIGDNADTDDDDDGVLDSKDDFPLDSNETIDSDSDGIGDNADNDDDDDGTPDSKDDFPLDPDEDTDTDSDGIGDNEDEDDDGDGVSDTEDIAPKDSAISNDESSSFLWIILLVIIVVVVVVGIAFARKKPPQQQQQQQYQQPLNQPPSYPPPPSG